MASLPVSPVLMRQTKGKDETPDYRHGNVMSGDGVWHAIGLLLAQPWPQNNGPGKSCESQPPPHTQLAYSG